MDICVCGGGNIGHVVAGFLAAKEDCNVSVLTRKPDRWTQSLYITDPNGRIFQGALQTVTDKAEDVIPTADIIILCLPGFAIREELLKIRESIKPGALVGSVVCNTGFFIQAFEILPPNVELFGFQRVPFISRITEYGKSAELKGYKPSLNLCIEHSKRKEEIRLLLENLFENHIQLLNNYYEVTLSNSNPLLHPSRLYTLWSEWGPDVVYDKNPLFYEDWTIEASELLVKMDEEFQSLLAVLGIQGKSIIPILPYYESSDAESLTAKIKSIEAFKGIYSPMKEIEDGKFIPDFKSRYFTEDIPYGLKCIVDEAHKQGLILPVIETVYDWGMRMIDNG